MNASVTYPAAQITLRARAYEDIDLGAVSTALNATKAGNCFRAVIKTDGGGNLRYLIDGSAPTSTVGTILYDGEQVELSHDDAELFRAIRVGAVNPQLRVVYLAPL
jgi:hypothetical protein